MTAPTPGNPAGAGGNTPPPMPDPNQDPRRREELWQAIREVASSAIDWAAPYVERAANEAIDRISFTYEGSRDAYEDAYEKRKRMLDAEGNVDSSTFDRLQHKYKEARGIHGYARKFLGALGGSAILTTIASEAIGAGLDITGGSHEYFQPDSNQALAVGTVSLALTAGASLVQHARLRRRDRTELRNKLDQEIRDYESTTGHDWNSTELEDDDPVFELIEARANVKNIRDRLAILADWGGRKAANAAWAIGDAIVRTGALPFRNVISRELNHTTLPTDVRDELDKAAEEVVSISQEYDGEGSYTDDPDYKKARKRYDILEQNAKERYGKKRITRKGVIEAGVGIVAATAYAKGYDITPFVDLPIVN